VCSRDEYRRGHTRSCSDHGRLKKGRAGSLPAAAHAIADGISSPTSVGFVSQYEHDQPLAANRSSAAGPRTPAIAMRSAPTRRAWECILSSAARTSCTELLVEPGPLSSPSILRQSYRWLADAAISAPASASNAEDHSGSTLPHHHERHQDLPQGLNPARAISETKDDGRSRMIIISGRGTRGERLCQGQSRAPTVLPLTVLS